MSRAARRSATPLYPHRSPFHKLSQCARRRASALASVVIAAALLASPSAHAGPVANAPVSVVEPWDSFFSVAFVPSGECYVVGAEGAMLTSIDGGRHWKRSAIAERGDLSWWDLHSIRFAPDGRTGWIGGENGLILKSTDGGRTWNAQASGTNENIFRITVVDAQTAFASGTNGLLMSTTDGGQHWQLHTQKGGLIFFDISFANANDGWTVGEFETILHTADGGKTWAPQMGGQRSNFKLPALFAIRFADARHGWAAGQGGTLLRTDDGGSTWQTVNEPSAAPMYSIVYVGNGPNSAPEELWGSGDGGALMHVGLKSDGSPAVQTPTVFSLSDVAFNGTNGVAVGLGGTIVHSSDSGAHWTVVTGK